MRAHRALPLIFAGLALPAPALAGTAGNGFTGPAYPAGRLALRPRNAKGTFASTAFRVPAGAIRTVALTLSRQAAKRVRRARRVPATLVATGGPALVAVPVTVTR